MKSSQYLLMFVLLAGIGLQSCVSPSVEKIGQEWCECKNIEIHQSSLQGDQCLQEWDKKYGKVEFNQQQVNKFNEIISECMNQ